jgi:hypothetical protein
MPYRLSRASEKRYYPFQTKVIWRMSVEIQASAFECFKESVQCQKDRGTVMRAIPSSLSALIIALALTAPARAEVVTLKCIEKVVLEVDLTRKTVTISNPNFSYPLYTVSAEITDLTITFPFKTPVPGLHEFQLNRATGHLSWRSPDTNGWLDNGMCERVAKPLL